MRKQTWFRRALAVTACLLAVLFFLGLARAEMLRHPVQVAAGQLPPGAVAVRGPAGDGVVVAGWADPDRGVYLRSSGDDGRTFGDMAVQVEEPGSYSDVRLCVDRDGRIVVGWLAAAGSSAERRLYLRPYQQVAKGPIIDPGPDPETSPLVFGAPGADVVTWELDCLDDGRAAVTWEETRLDSDGNPLPDHDIHLSFIQLVGGRRVAHREFLASRDAPGDNTSPDVELRPDGSTWIAWRNAPSSPGGPQGGQTQAMKCACWPPDDNGRCDDNEHWPCDYVVTHGFNGGNPYVDEAEPSFVDLSLDPSSGTREAVDASGHVALVWRDDREGRYRAWLTFTEDGGRTWWHEEHGPVSPDGGACSGGNELHPRGAGQWLRYEPAAGDPAATPAREFHLVVAFTCDEGDAGALANLSRDGGRTFVYEPAVSLVDPGTAVDRVDVACDPVVPGECHYAMLLPDGHRRAGTSAETRDGDPSAWYRQLEYADGEPADPGTGLDLAAGGSRPYLLIDRTGPETNELALNAATAEAAPRHGLTPPTQVHGLAVGTIPSRTRGIGVLARVETSGGTTSLRVSRSLDGGTTWEDLPDPVARGDLLAPALATMAPADSGYGRAMLLWLEDDADGRNIRSATCTEEDDCSSWTPAGQVNRDPLTGETGQVATCAAPVGGTRRTYAAWYCNWHDDPGGVSPSRSAWVCLSYWVDDDEKWRPVVLVDGDSPWGGHARGTVPALACDREGNVAVAWRAWQTDPSGGTNGVLANTSANGGVDWLGTEILSNTDAPEKWAPHLAAGKQGFFVAAWFQDTGISNPSTRSSRVFVNHTCGPGSGWSAEQELCPEGGPYAIPSRDALSVAARAPRALVDWHDRCFAWGAQSRDWGNSWACFSSLQLCNDDDDPTCAVHGPSWAGFSPRGGAFLVFPRNACDDDSRDDGIDAWIALDGGDSGDWQGPIDLTPNLAGRQIDDGPVPPANMQPLCCPRNGPPCGFPVPVCEDENELVWGIGDPGGPGSDRAEASAWRLPAGTPPAIDTLVPAPGEDGKALTWTAPSFPDGTMPLYDVYRLPTENGQVPDDPVFACTARHLAENSWRDPEDPAPGEAFFYLVSGVGPGGEEGPAGSTLPVDSCDPPPPPDECF